MPKSQCQDSKLRIQENTGSPVTCDRCQQETTTRVVDRITGFDMMFCERCQRILPQSWDAFSDRVKRAWTQDTRKLEKLVKLGNHHPRINQFHQEIREGVMSGLSVSIAVNRAVDLFRKYHQRSVKLDLIVDRDSFYEENPCIDPEEVSLDQKIDFNKAVLNLWTSSSQDQTPEYARMLAAILYNSDTFDLLGPDMQDRVNMVIKGLPKPLSDDASHKEIAEVTGFSVTDKALKKYWKVRSRIGRRLARILIDSGILRNVMIKTSKEGRTYLDEVVY